MIGQSGSVLVVAEPKQFFDIVLLNWMALRELEQTYLALASVINLMVGWGKTAKVYEDMRMLFKSIDDMY